ncbi:DoxX family protein [Paenibacillus sp. GSMTC-2017]|uniref:DoxX family protein n=1 Tax=Paenibacillus sp. GSMTC-2017 TaxID=2794350 RepID=UPI0018D6867B|nr:DoxX family protein [Paenibacillus sp. GSMTC-2017]MBH5319215.1 DoxX family protein [Paenibacillus sp. GSMTC-2017]
MVKFWNESVWSAWLVTLVRIVLGYEWLTAGWGKLNGDKPFDATGFITNALSNPVTDRATGDLVYPTYISFLENIALPNVKVINILVPWGEFLVGLGLILGALTLTAAFFGIFLNFLFMFSGSVSVNPWLLLLGFLVFLAGSNTGRFGADRYLLPWCKSYFTKLFGGQSKSSGISANNGSA